VRCNPAIFTPLDASLIFFFSTHALFVSTHGEKSQRSCLDPFPFNSHATSLPVMNVQYQCPHCLSLVSHKRSLIRHFQSNVNCPYKNPDNCLYYPSHSLPPVGSVSLPLHDSSESFHHSSVDDVPVCDAILGPDDSQLSSTLQSSYDTDDDDSSALSIECNPDYPSVTSNLILQADSDLTDEDDDSAAPSNVFTSDWTLPTPSSQRVIVPTTISPVEESLLRLLIQNNLPKRMYTDIMSWAHSAYLHKYDFANSLQYQTVLSRMLRKYQHVSGGPPIRETVSVPGYAAIDVYRFDFLEQVHHLLLDEHLMTDSLWGYNELIDPVSGD
jgi:hypothetical protein